MNVVLLGLFFWFGFVSGQVNFVSVSVSVSESTGVYAFVPTVDVALRDMQQRYPAVFKNYTWTQDSFVDSSTCNLLSEATVITNLGKLISRIRNLESSGLTVIIQPTCGDTFRYVGDLAREMDFLALMCTNADDTMMNKKRFPSLVSFGFSRSPFGDALTGLMDKYSWKRIVVLWDQLSNSQYRGRLFEVCRCATDALLKRNDIRYIKYDLDSTTTTPDYQFFLLRAANHSRVIMLCSLEAPERQILTAAYDLGMISGDYVFIFLYSMIVPNDYQLRWNLNNSDDQKVYAGLGSVWLLALEHSNVQTIDHVMARVQRRKKEMFDQPIDPEQNHNDVMLGCYYAVESLAQVLNESYDEVMEGNFISGSKFARKFANRTFSLENRVFRMTPSLTRITNVDVKQFDVGLNTFQTKFQYNFIPGEFTTVNGRPIRWKKGTAPPDQPKCGFQDETCSGLFLMTIAGACAGAAVFVLFIALTTTFALRFYKIRNPLTSDWMISAADLDEVTTLTQSTAFIADDITKAVHQPDDLLNQSPNDKAIFREQFIWKTNITITSPEHFLNNKPLRRLLQQMMYNQNPNVNTFQGVCIESVSAMVISSYCKRGSLAGLTAASADLDWDLKSSLIIDLINGISFIHKSSLAYHGSLTITRCLLDNFFGLKISDLGYTRLRILATNSNSATATLKATSYGAVCDDINQFGSIAFELTFENSLPAMPGNQVAAKLVALITECREATVENKPTASHLKKALNNLFFSTETGEVEENSLFDLLLRRLEKHAEFLEGAVLKRTVELLQEQQRCDDLLLEMLPREIIRQLRLGETIVAQLFDSVTILFSDIPGFTEFVADSGAYVVVEFLHKTYSNFDQVLATFLVYKVETINDSYMVASGLPVKHDMHVVEVCKAAMAMQATFMKAHEESGMKLRIGINTGPVAAGIVGSKSPRYCLFGNTVNTASRMESHGLPSRIHVSEEIAQIGRPSGLTFAPRGEINIKGKGLCKTFWLEG